MSIWHSIMKIKQNEMLRGDDDNGLVGQRKRFRKDMTFGQNKVNWWKKY